MTCEKEILVYILPDIFVAEVTNLYKPTQFITTCIDIFELVWENQNICITKA